MNWYHSVDISAIHAGFRSGTISEEAIGPKRHIQKLAVGKN